MQIFYCPMLSACTAAQFTPLILLKLMCNSRLNVAKHARLVYLKTNDNRSSLPSFWRNIFCLHSKYRKCIDRFRLIKADGYNHVYWLKYHKLKVKRITFLTDFFIDMFFMIIYFISLSAPTSCNCV